MKRNPGAWLPIFLVILFSGLLIPSALGAKPATAGSAAGKVPAPVPQSAASATALVTAPQDAEAAALWRDADETRLEAAGPRLIVPRRYRFLALDLDQVKHLMASAPMEGTVVLRKSPLVLTLPLPDGTSGRFAVVESPIVESALQVKYPETRTYLGQGLDDPTATARLDVTPVGFHAMILSGVNGAVFIDPYRRGDTTHYLSYFKRDFVKPGAEHWRCHRDDSILPLDGTPPPPSPGRLAPSGTQLRTYRAAVAATGEYTQYHGGTVAGAHAAQVTTMNRVVGVYEREVAIRMVLVANNDNLIYTDPTTDPYTNDTAAALLNENQANCDAVIGDANYDIGHVFGTGGGGLASLWVPCVSGSKARGETGSGAPVGDPYDIDYVAHEMGHQWGGQHTFNGTTSNCGGGNREPTTAYEPGSGSTIQAYAGICGAEDLQPHSDPYFHVCSFDQIVAYSTTGNGNTCAVTTATGNNPPSVNAGAAYTIPARTPFTLTGSATDPDGDALTYCWEQFDLGTAGPPNTDDGSRPIFRSFNPTTSPSRTLPRLSDILNDTATFGESMATTSRVLHFVLTARDNRAGGGGVDYDTTTVTTVGTAGPFRVTSPAGGVWGAGTTQTVTWDVAGTMAAPISCASVDILLSIDGGLNFPVTLAAGTPNDGSQAVIVPALHTTTARIKVRAVGNIFFDISNPDFAICDPTCTASADPIFGAIPLPVTFTASASGTGCTGTPTFAWDFGDGATGSGSPVSHTYTAAGTFTWTCTATLDGATATDSGTVTACAAATITAEPTGSTICQGQTATLSLTATGSFLLTYQWQQSPDGVGSWTNAGTGNPWTTPALSQTTWYRCVVTNACGTDTSAVVQVTVNYAPVVTVPPADDTICFGETTTLSVTATGTEPLAYQWQLSPDGVGAWADVPGAVTNPWTTPELAASGFYRCRVTNGCGTADSAACTVTVLPLTAITAFSFPLSVCAGEPVTLTVTGLVGAPPYTYDWWSSPDGVTFTPIAGAHAAGLTLPGLTARTVFKLRVTGTCGYDERIVIVEVVTPPAITLQPADAWIRSHGSARLELGYVGTEPVSIQWYQGETGDVSHPVPDATLALFQTPPLTDDTTRFWARVSNGCGTADTRTATVTVRNTYYLAHVAGGPDWWSRLDMANTDHHTHPVLLEAFDAAGTPVESLELPGGIAALAAFGGDLSTLLSPETLAGDVWLKLTTQAELMGVLSWGTLDGQARTALPFEEEGFCRLALPYVYESAETGGSYFTGLTLVNVTEEPAAVLLEAFSDTGAKLGENTVVIPPNGKYARLVRLVFPAVTDPLSIRSVLVHSTRELAGFELFGNWVEKGVAGVPAYAVRENVPKDWFFGMYLNEMPPNDTWYTGLALLNLDPEPATVMADVYAASGAKLGYELIPLAPMQQLAREVWELFDPARYAGAATVMAGAYEQAAGLEIVRSRMSPPAFDGLAGITQGASLLIFPCIPDPAEAQTTIRLTNQTTAPDTLLLVAFAADGTQVGSVQEPIPASAQLTFDPAVRFPAPVKPVAWVAARAWGGVAGHAFVHSRNGEWLMIYPGLPGIPGY
ncbi:MAG: PKD domain-containing protein [Acidobacteria bacterium]|nr:PKD domain-containing protein [Acidobacteriota bacterium]